MSTPQEQIPKGFEEVSITPSFIDQEAKKFNLSKSSGYRSKEHNKKVGGVSNSNHLTGQASDYIGSKEDKKRFYNHLKTNYKYELKELLDEGNHLHIATKGIPEGFEEVSSKLNLKKESSKVESKKPPLLTNEITPESRMKFLESNLSKSSSSSTKPKLGKYEGYSKIGSYVLETAEKMGISKHLPKQLLNTLEIMTSPEAAKNAWKEPSSTLIGGLIEAQLSPLQTAEKIRKEKGLSVIESWTDPEILGHSGLALVPGIGPILSSFSISSKSFVESLEKGDKEGAKFHLKEASQYALIAAIPFIHEKLKLAKEQGLVKDIKIEEGSLKEPITTYEDSTKHIIINRAKLEEAIKEGRNPAAAIDEGIRHEIGHAIVDSPTTENKLLLKKTAQKVLGKRKANEFNKAIDENKPKLYNSEEKIVEEITKTGDSLKEDQKIPEGFEQVESSTETGSITPKLANAMSGGLAKFVERDIGGLVSKSIKMSQEALSILSPKRGVPKEALDLMSRMRGSRSFAEARVKLWGEEIKKAFDKAPKDEIIAFMDRVKTGQSQSNLTLSRKYSLIDKTKNKLLNKSLKPDEQLQDIANYYRSLDDEVYDSIQNERQKAGLDNTTYLENHFRIFWKDIPGQVQPKGIVAKLKGAILPKRPLSGTKGFLKQHTLTDVSEGIQKGGKPVSYNPQTLMEMSYADSYKYLTALRMWNGAKDIGLRKFVKLGKDIPNGFRPVSDPISQSYFRVKQGLVKNGQWVVEENFARILENHLSRDYWRESEIGSSIVDTKNTMTMAELGLSAFHGVFEGIESSGSDIGLGLRQFVNLGLEQGNPKYLAKGAKTITRGLTQGGVIEKAKLGGDVIRYIKDSQQFIESTKGQSLLKQFPDAIGLINDLFVGGAQLKMAEGYRTNWMEGMKAEWKEGNFPGAAIRSPLAGVEKMMLPLFDNFIPKLKIGTFLEEYSTALLENKKALDSGKITRPELARKTWDFIEDRFGEMNFDNLYWNNTLKTSLQVAFRSITWKLGNMRAALGGIPEQAFEVGRSLKQGEIPKLTPKFSWLAGMSLNTVLISSIISKGTTGKYPWEHAKNAADLIYQIIYPRVSKEDESKRITTPTYWNDLAHLQHDPKGYITSSLSSTLTEFSDLWSNKDFYGNWIYNPSDPIHKQTMDSLKYIFPTPFSVQAFSKAFKKGEPMGEALEGFAGLRKAPFYIREPEKQEYFNLREQQKQERKRLLKEAN